eukprot:TRINITY_DN719_c1_g1_i1.p1 TRINITY_DN719_c1_g1~~TRINITY_DN719_c1_g1_i1.p1  ORF type:complete len:311 (+),score=45.80 TRINITY_DN719_c1_g1_i1:12-944(+)
MEEEPPYQSHSQSSSVLPQQSSAAAVVTLDSMAHTSRVDHHQQHQQHNALMRPPVDKEGTLIKLAGYFWKTREPRYFRLIRNKLAYYIAKEDTVPKKVIDLDGCGIEITSSTAPFSFVLTERASGDPHKYYLFSNKEREFKSWVKVLRRASNYYLEIFYGGVVSEAGDVIEYCLPHWVSEKPLFKELVSEALQQKKYNLSFIDQQEDKQGMLIRSEGYRVIYLFASTWVFFCVTDEKAPTLTGKAFLEDLRERFEQIPQLNETTSKEFGLLTKEVRETSIVGVLPIVCVGVCVCVCVCVWEGEWCGGCVG